MRAQATALLFFLLLTVPISFAIDDLCATCDQVVLQPTVSGSIITVRATHINLNYYNQLQHLANQSDLQDISNPDLSPEEIEQAVREKFNLPPDVIGKALDSQLEPLKDAALHFKLEDAPIVTEANAVACDPINTNAEGIAACDIKFYRNSSGQAEETSKLSRCKTLYVTYDGYSNGITYKPSMAQVILCGENNNALAQIGKDITTEVDNRRNDCVPVFILLGILLAAMYYSGKNPLSLFDITIPRLPGTRKFRMAKTGVMIGFSEKSIMNTMIMNKARDALAGTIAASLASQRGVVGKSLTANDRREIKKTVKDILAGKGKYSNLKTATEKSEAFSKFIKDNFKNEKIAEKATRAVEELLALWAIAEEDKGKAGFARGGYNKGIEDARAQAKKVGAHFDEEVSRLSGDHALVRGSRLGKHITEFATGGKKWQPVNISKIPIIKQTLGNAMLVTAQNLNVWAAMRRAKREAAGAVVGNIARKAFKADKNTWLIGKTVEKYDPRNKKLSTFVDSAYKLARDAIDAQHALTEEQVRDILARTLINVHDFTELAVYNKNLGRWVINSDVGKHLTAFKENEDRVQLLKLLNELNTYHSKDENYQYKNKLKELSDLCVKAGGKKLTETELTSYAESLTEINVLGHGLHLLKEDGTPLCDKSGKVQTIILEMQELFTCQKSDPIPETLSSKGLPIRLSGDELKKIAGLRAGEGINVSHEGKRYYIEFRKDKLTVYEKHAENLDPVIIRAKMDGITKYIEKLEVHTQVGASMYYNMLEKIALGPQEDKEQATYAQHAQLWLLTILRRTAGFSEDLRPERFASEAELESRKVLVKRINDLAQEVQAKVLDAKDFRERFRKILSENPEIRKLMFRIDHDHFEMCLDTLTRKDMDESFLSKKTRTELRKEETERETKGNPRMSIMKMIDFEFQREVAARQFSKSIFDSADKIVGIKNNPKLELSDKSKKINDETNSLLNNVQNAYALDKKSDFKFEVEEYRPLRMAWERLMGKMESKFGDQAEFHRWSMVRLNGMIEHDANANLHLYYYRMYEKNTNNLQWLTNWWLAEHEDGQKKLKDAHEGKATSMELSKEDYHKLMERGVRYADLKKGLWLTDTDFHTNPMAILDAKALMDSSNLNSRGELVFDNKKVAKEWANAWKSLDHMPITSGSERLLNFYMLTNMTMPDIHGNQQARKNAQGEEEWSRIPNDKAGLQLLGSIAGHVKPGTDTRKEDIYGKQANDIRTSYMKNHYMLVPRDVFLGTDEFRSARSSGGRIGKWLGGSYPEMLQMPGGLMGKIFGEEKYREKMQKHVGGFIEEMSLSATYYNSLRLQSWFETQARMRAALDDFARALNRDDSDLVSDSWRDTEKKEKSAKKELEEKLDERNKARKDYEKALQAHSPDAARLKNELKLAEQNAKNAEDAYSNAKKAWKQNKDNLEADLNMFKLKGALWDYYQVSERASMRDPRAGSMSIGSSQPFPTGYHTGQQMYEPVESVFGFGILPDQDMLHRFTYRLAYRMNYAFVTHTRGAYGMLAGYPVRSDIYEGPPQAQGLAIREGLRSLFKPGGSWISTNWRKPYVREWSEYTHPLQHKSFLGIGISESFGTQEIKMMPLSFKAPDSTPEHKAAVTLKMLREGMTLKDIEKYFETEEYALGETWERRHKRVLYEKEVKDDEGNVTSVYEYKIPWYVKIPVVREVLGETYYSGINRTGDKYTAHGEGMRDYEFYTMSYRNYQKAYPPGMNFLDWSGRQHLAPRLASYALSFGNLARNAGTLQLELSKHGGEKESYAALLRRDANADVTVATANLISLAARHEHELRAFSPFQFTATKIAMSPGWGLMQFAGASAAARIKSMKSSGPLSWERVANYIKPAYQYKWDENQVECSHGHSHLRGAACPTCQKMSASNMIMEEIEKDKSIKLKNSESEEIAMVKGMRAGTDELLRIFPSFAYKKP